MTAPETLPLHLCILPGEGTASALRASVNCLKHRPDVTLTIVADSENGAVEQCRRFVKNKYGNPVDVIAAGTGGGLFEGRTNDGGEAVIVFMPAGDWLDYGALDALASSIAYRGADIAYPDDDFIDDKGHLGDPRFKPEANYEYLAHYDYVGDLLCVRKSVLARYGGIDPADFTASRYALLLHALADGRKVGHVPRLLYHTRNRPAGRGLAPVLRSHFAREGAGTEILTGRNSTFRVKRRVTGSARTTIVIPFKDRPRLLRQCMSAILGLTHNGEFEVLGISNCSLSSETYAAMDEFSNRDRRVRFVEFNVPFNFSALVNHGVAQASGDYVVLMNNDIRVANGEWLDAMLEYGQRADVGVVGAKLLYPDGSVQHAGLSVQGSGHIGHMHRNFPGDSPGYMNRLICAQEVSAVTAALCLFRRELHERLGGFDEDRFGIAYNDVDFCLRAGALGLRNIFTPYALAFHHESISRGYEDTVSRRSRFRKEHQNFWRRYRTRKGRPDPNYNPNLDQYRDDFSY